MEKILIITGGSKGIGKATAAEFSANNWKIINISRNPCLLKNVFNIELNLSNPNFEEKLRELFVELLKSQALISLVHNAAYHFNDSITDQNPLELSKALNVSIVSPALINKILITYMTPGSSIIYLGSTLAEKAVPNTASYSTLKHATIGMMRATCQDLAKKKIHTACICPGFTDTDMLHEHLSHNPDFIAMAKQKVTFERFIEPREIAELIYFAATKPVINGSVIHANLGQLET